MKKNLYFCYTLANILIELMHSIVHKGIIKQRKKVQKKLYLKKVLLLINVSRRPIAALPSSLLSRRFFPNSTFVITAGVCVHPSVQTKQFF